MTSTIAPTPNGINDTEAVQTFLNDSSFGVKDFGGRTYIMDGWSTPISGTSVLSIPWHVRKICNGKFVIRNPINRNKSLFEARNHPVRDLEFAEDAIYPTRQVKFTDIDGLEDGYIIFLQADNSWGGVSQDNPKLGQCVKVVEIDPEKKIVTFDRVLLADYKKFGNNARATVFSGLIIPIALRDSYTGPSGPFSTLEAPRYPLVGNLVMENLHVMGPGKDYKLADEVTDSNERFLQTLYTYDLTVRDCSWSNLNGSGVTIQTGVGVKIFNCRSERVGKYSVLISAGADDIHVDSLTDSYSLASVATGGGGTGVNTNIRYTNCTIFYPSAVGLDCKYATADVYMSGNKVYGDQGVSYTGDYSGEGRKTTGMKSRASVTVMIGNYASHCGKGYEIDLQGAARGGGCWFLVDDNAAEYCNDFGILVANGDNLTPAASFGGSITRNQILSQKSFLDPASTVQSAAIALRSVEAPLENIEIDSNRIIDCDANAYGVYKAANGTVGKVRIGEKNTIELGAVAKAGCSSTLTVSFNIATDTITASVPHNLAAGTWLRFITNGILPGLVTTKNYVVTTEGLTANTFKVSETSSTESVFDLTGSASGTNQITSPSWPATLNVADDTISTTTPHGLAAGMYVQFTTTGVFPTIGLKPNTDYTVMAAGLTSKTFRVSEASSTDSVDISGGLNGTSAVINTVTSVSQNVTFDEAAGVIRTTADHGLTAGTTVRFSTTGYLPTNGLRPGKNYIVASDGLTDTAFKVSDRGQMGPVVDIAGTGSGTYQVEGTFARRKIGTSFALPHPTAEWGLPYVATFSGLGEKTAKRLPRDFFITGVKAELLAPQTSGSDLTVSIRVDGVVILSTKLSFANGVTLAENAVMHGSLNRNVTAGTRISASVDQIGSGAAGLEVTLKGCWI